MPFVLDIKGVLHDKDRLERASVLYLARLEIQMDSTEDPRMLDSLKAQIEAVPDYCNVHITGTNYPTGQVAFDAQTKQLEENPDKLPSIQHFCLICMPSTSWEIVVNE